MPSPLKGLLLQDETLEGIMEYAKGMYPNEIILLARGKKVSGYLFIEEVLSPPFQRAGRSFASYAVWSLPYSPSIVGTIHSHPSGALYPSLQDLLQYYGRVMGIAAYPYAGKMNLAFFDRNGNQIPFFIGSPSELS
ncbi:MAG: Mov34/MPN/PAD-1 family protein [TACK group archaeon]|nr:Mov34/MPN/PAD-1 family protein [TACK group archaeon]